MPREKVYKPSETLQKQYMGGGLEPPKFVPSYYEWLHKKGKDIHYSNITTAAAYTIYTVADDETLYLTSYFLQGHLRQVPLMVIQFNFWSTNLPSTHFAAYLIRFSLFIQGTTEAIVINPAIPLKITSKEKLQVGVSGTEGILWVGFTGFTIKNKDIPII